MKLSVKGLALTFAILHGLCMLVWGLLAAWFNYGIEAVPMAASFYPGFAASIVGAIIGFIWGFVDGAICGALIAWLYNKLTK